MCLRLQHVSWKHFLSIFYINLWDCEGDMTFRLNVDLFYVKCQSYKNMCGWNVPTFLFQKLYLLLIFRGSLVIMPTRLSLYLIIWFSLLYSYERIYSTKLTFLCFFTYICGSDRKATVTSVRNSEIGMPILLFRNFRKSKYRNSGM